MYYRQPISKQSKGNALARSRGLDKTMMITIGRDSSNDIVLTDVSISRTHASIESMIKGRLLIHDTHSHNGTYLWRQEGWIRVKTVRLGPDDRIRFGDHEMSFSELSFAF
jgi:pSer/pThr/pTyr-binding forkhead associated (FHA) protein